METARVGLLWRAEWDPAPADGTAVERCRLHGVFAAFAALGVAAEPVVYADDRVEAIRAQLLSLDAVLVWVNPIEQGLDRTRLDPLLREVAAAGVFVSAHPDVILKIATKRVLADTAQMSWSAETHLYASHDQLAAELPGRLAARGPLVLKQHRGMGGAGVWKVELDGAGTVLVQHAAKGSRPETTRLDDFLARCRPYFAGEGLMVEQPYQPRLAEGMIRVYLSGHQVVGFAHQHPTGLLHPDVAATLPTGKAFLPADEPAYQQLRNRVESDWLRELQRLTGVATADLPLIWDIDFLLGPRDAAGNDTHLLCEINASSTFAFPDTAMPDLARATLERLHPHHRAARP